MTSYLSHTEEANFPSGSVPFPPGSRGTAPGLEFRGRVEHFSTRVDRYYTGSNIPLLGDLTYLRVSLFHYRFDKEHVVCNSFSGFIHSFQNIE